MSDLLRQDIIASAELIVVKVGTRVLTRDDGQLDTGRISKLAEQLQSIHATGRRVILVSSGAVGAGMNLLGLKKRPQDVATLQAVAAVGQARLINEYDLHFRNQGYHAAQVLLTADDLDDRKRYLNVRNTLLRLLQMNAVPVINENDTVAVDELMRTFGDNDRLAAVVTNLLRASLLVILSDVEGLFDGDPQLATSRVVPVVTDIDATVESFVRDRRGDLSKGGMSSKLEAARIATTAGENVIIASGRRLEALSEILEGRCVGTLFVAQGKSITPLKRWIGFSAQPRGTFVLDEGACQAILTQGRSLLAIGVREISGKFEKGDVVSLRTSSGEEIARGLTNYDASDMERIYGQRSTKIAEILGHCPYEEVIHRDNLTIV
ncbi:MAG: glutamate 5-kinase [Pirellulaceae bacterium]|nr:glutamate 5-kinase [Planctomycetales bacterium]